MTGTSIPLNYNGSANKMTGIPLLAMANATFGTSLYAQNDDDTHAMMTAQQKKKQDNARDNLNIS
jgi:hypothetical protein